MTDGQEIENEEHEITKFQNTFARIAGALALMVAAIPTAIGWTDVIPTLSDTQQKFSQVNVSVMVFSAIGLIYYYREALSAVFREDKTLNFGSKVIRHIPLYCFVFSIVSMYLYFSAYYSADPQVFWPILAYSGMFVFPAILLTVIALRDYATDK